MSEQATQPALSGKTVAELKSMVVNAEKILAGPNVKQHPAATAFREAARTELATRRVGGAARAPDAALEAAIARLRAVAADAARRFDLSAETAKAAGVSTPHSLLASNGQPKVGGGVRTKKFRRCPYISYRGPGGIAMLQYAVPHEAEEGFWAGGLTTAGSPESKTGFDTAMEEEAAVAAFLAALAGVAPQRG